MAEPNPESCRRCAGVVPWFSLWGNLGLAIYKLVVGTVGGSAALVADAMHSFADVVGSTGILVATKISGRKPDPEYPYGRGKAEFLGAAFVYILLLFFAGGITFSAIRSIINPSLEAPHLVTLLGAIVSVFYNYIMYRYATCVGKRNHSPALLADAFENRADAVSSVACIGGIGGAMFIHPVCDPIAALVVGLVIFYNCQEQLRDAAGGLMDRGLDEKQVQAVTALARGVDGVTGIRFVRTRQTGAKYWIDLGIEVPGDTDVATTDSVVAQVKARFKNRPQFHFVEVFVGPPEQGVGPRPRSRRRLPVLQVPS